jgi:hypothetical protein
MRRQLQIESAGSLDLHDHVAWYGDGADGLYALANAALEAGARRNQKLLFVAEDPDLDRLDEIDEIDRLLDAGQLELHPIDEVYGTGRRFNADDQLATFQEVLTDAVASGYRGICVVADNTPFVTGEEADYHRWLEWEQLADRFQARSAVTGICYFDRGAVSEERQADLAAVHPVRTADAADAEFTVFADDDAVALTGAVDRWSLGRFRRIVETAPQVGPLVVDVSGAEFLDHRALEVLNEAATPHRQIHLRGASPAAIKLFSLIAAATPHLHFE